MTAHVVSVSGGKDSTALYLLALERLQRKGREFIPVFADTVSSRELNQDIGRAKRAAADGPVVITDRGRPSHVLLSWAEYRRLSGGPRNLAAVLAGPGLSDIPFEPEKSGLKAREVDFD